MRPAIAYLADGRLHLKLADEPSRVLESPFAESVRAREVGLVHRNAWKAQGPDARFLAAGISTGDEQAAANAYAAITGLSRGRTPGEILYSIETTAVAGVFAFDVGTAAEKWLFHGNQQRVRFPSTQPGHDLIACSVRSDGFRAHIGVMRADGSALTEVTEGDSVDLAPSWVPQAPRRLVYQSAGVGRDASGRPVGVGPSAIHQLDIERGDVRPLAESAAHDLFGPRIGTDGALYYLRRPWNARPRFAPLRLLLDLLLLPFRLVAAIFNWLNFFTVRYSGKPLLTPQGAQQRQADARQWLIWGNLIGAADETRNRWGGATEDEPGLVPPSWQLVRQPTGGAPEVIARGVCSFDLAADGVVYSTGSAVYHRGHAGTPVRLCTDSRIEQVIALP